MTSPDPMTTHPKLGRLLVVDDEVKVMTALCDTLAGQGYETAGFTSGAEALDMLRRQEFDLLLTDMQMSEMHGMALLREAQAVDPHLVAIMMTGHGTIETAVEAMKLGAFDYVQKPLKLRDLLPVLTRAMEFRRLRQENLQLRETLGIYELSTAIGFTLDVDVILNKVLDAALEQLGADEASVLVPNRDGKELYVAVARGPRREHILNQTVPLGESIAGWVARYHESLILNGPVNDARFAPRYPRQEICAAVSLPMMVGGQCVGVLNVNATRPRRPFTLGQLKAITILAGTAAPALRAASLYAELRSSEERFRRITTSMLDFVIQVGVDGNYQYVTPSCKAMLGYEPAELIGRSAFDLIHSDDLSRFREMFDRIMHVVEPVRAEFRCRQASGGYIWLESVASALRNDEGKCLGVIAAGRDITERKQAEEALRHSETQLREVWDKSVDGMRLTDGQGIIRLANEAFCRIVGKPRAAIEGRLFTDMYAEPQPDLLADYRAKFAARTIQASDIKNVVLANGRKAHLELSYSFLDLPGEEPQLLSVIRDATDHKVMEAQLRQAQKMEAFGQLAGGVAHDFNNLLTVITGYSEMLLSGAVPADKQRDYTREIRKAGDRAASLTRQLLAFSRKQMLQPVELDLNNLISETEKLLRRLIGEDIDLATSLDPDLGWVKADPGQIEQVIMNLVVNARDAMPTGGLLTIETRNVYLDNNYARLHAEMLPGKYVMMAVTDSGCGIDDDTKAKIFEPFFTTKEVGKGTGLGLATVHGIIKQSNGGIEVYSEVGRGSTFKIYLPCLRKAATGASLPGLLAPMPRGTETILLAEDEEAVRIAVRLTLGSCGYTVIDARNGDEALKVSKQHQGPIHLLMTDVIMPVMGGRQLAESVQAARQGIKVLYLSGYTDDAVVRHGVLEAGVAFLQKPFTPMILARKVRSVLGPEAPRSEPAPERAPRREGGGVG